MTTALPPPDSAAAKTELRRAFMAQRQGLPRSHLQAGSQQLSGLLAAWLRQRQARQVLFYHPLHSEVDLRPLAVLAPELELALPVLAGRGSAMGFARWTPTTPLLINRYGIAEPNAELCGGLLSISSDAVILVPSLAVDVYGVRLGYGGGFYDRFLAAHPLTSVGVVFAEFLCPALPRQSHDVALHFVATEHGVRPLPLR